MLRHSRGPLLRPGVQRVREGYALYTLNAAQLFPLLKAGNLSSSVVRHFEDYQGRVQPDADHALPVIPARSNVNSAHHVWTNWDKRLNPQLISTPQSLKPQDEYIGPRAGINLPSVGWVRVGSSWKYSKTYWKTRSDKHYGEWLERNVTPRWRLVPRIADFNPQSRYAGKLEYSEVKISEIIWAIDTHKLNRNEVITLWHLREAGIVTEARVVWPGLKLVDDGVTPLYPISLELQNATPDAIAKIEGAGGSFVSAYLSIEGLYQTMHPEEFPVFVDQQLPDRNGMQNVAMSDQARGSLCRYFESEMKYAHPDAGRRASHYVRPPTDRDYPATYEEFEQIKHHQKWHLNQPGTGTVLPMITTKSLEDAPKFPTILQ